MRDQFIDIETYSSVDLKKCGVYRYVEAPDFEIQLLSYALGDGDVRTVDLAMGEGLPAEFADAILNADTMKWAWNCAFERICLNEYFRRLPSGHMLHGKVTPIEQWSDDMVLAAVCGLPMSLGGAGEALGLPQDKAKDKRGTLLVNWFSKPCKPTKTSPDRTRHLPADYPEKWGEYKEYNSQDVVAQRSIHRTLERWIPGKAEHDAWVMDQGINDRGVRVDLILARNAVEMDARYKAELTERAIALTGMGNPNSVEQVKQWLMEQEGLEVPSLNKKVVADVVARLETERARDFMAIREELSKSSTKKYSAMTNSACADGHAKGCFQFYGAGRTGRWAGRRVQLQNMSKNKSPDLDLMRCLVKDGDYEGVSTIYGKVSSVLSELVRPALIPEDGHRFIVCDYSAIEARVLSWIAGEEWALDEFRGDGLIYEATGARMFGVPKESIAKGGANHHLRQAAKTAELACVAEGQLVVTDRGLVPIEQITTEMRVWDGVAWVRHAGLIHKGVRPTIRIGGIELTADHKILTEKGMRPSAESEGLHWADVRFPDRHRARERACAGERQKSADSSLSMRVRNQERNNSRPLNPQKETDAFLWVQGRRVGCDGSHETRNDRQQAIQRLERNAATMHEPSRPELGAVWGQGHRGLPALAKQLRELLVRHGPHLSPRSTTGQKGQQWAVFSGKLPVVYKAREWEKQEVKPDGLDLRRACDGGRTGRADGGSVRDHVEPGRAQREITLRRGRSAVQVYDLLNAGPRHRFCLYDPESGVLRCVSNCGYGGGMGAMKAFGADKMGMTDEEIVRAVDLWREAHPMVAKLWKALERAAIRCVVHGTAQRSTIGGIRFDMEKGILWMTLPSGRRISYFGARYGPGTGKYTRGKKVLSYMGVDQKSRKWTRIETFSGKITENLVQATARDCLRDAMLNLTAAGFDIRMHIHDEVVISEPIGGRRLEDVAEIMGRTPEWARGLPLRGDGYYCNYYIKD